MPARAPATPARCSPPRSRGRRRASCARRPPRCGARAARRCGTRRRAGAPAAHDARRDPRPPRGSALTRAVGAEARDREVPEAGLVAEALLDQLADAVEVGGVHARDALAALAGEEL